MQVILLEKVVNVGDLGEVAKVKDGYARNYLIPQRLAKRATKENLATFEAERAERMKVAADKLAAAQAQGEKLAGSTISINQKAGVDGRLFGSVTNFDIAEALKAGGFLGREDASASAERSAEAGWRTRGPDRAAYRRRGRRDSLGGRRARVSERQTKRAEPECVAHSGRPGSWKDGNPSGFRFFFHPMERLWPVRHGCPFGRTRPPYQDLGFLGQRAASLSAPLPP